MSDNQHCFVVICGRVCVTTNRKRIDANDLYARLTEKYGATAADKPGRAAFLVRLTTEQIHAVLTDAEKAPPPLVDVPDERVEPDDWHEVPQWAKSYIVEMERMLDIHHVGPGDWD